MRRLRPGASFRVRVEGLGFRGVEKAQGWGCWCFTGDKVGVKGSRFTCNLASVRRTSKGNYC